VTREEAALAVVQEILADPVQTARVVVAAVVAQDVLDRNHPAFDILWSATTK
jgi:hypothetical protein